MSGTPRLASNDDSLIVLRACRERRALVSRDRSSQTERCLLQVWKTTFARLQEAVAEHIELGRKVYTKFGNAGQPVGLEANVTLFEGLEIYVEMKIRGGHMVILAAHSHYTTPLPQ